jgi:hypothetical protein
MSDNVDRAVEETALRQYGMLGRGGGMGNTLYAIDYEVLPPEAKQTIQLIAQGGPFPHPHRDGTAFGNRFGDLPSRGEYLEFTVPTPGVNGRGARRIVARRNGILFFTACHYERVQGPMSAEARREATSRLDEHWRNGFYVVTGMRAELRQQVAAAIRSMHGRP